MRTRPTLKLVDVRVVDASAPMPDHASGNDTRLDPPTDEEVSTGPGGGTFTLSVDHEGLTLHLAAIPSVVRHFAWRSVDTLGVATEDPASDVAPRTSLELTVEGQTLRMSVPAEQLPPASLCALEDIADAAFRGSTPAVGLRRVLRGHGTGPRSHGRRPRAFARVMPAPGGPQDLSVRRARQTLLGVVGLVVALSLMMASTSRTPVPHGGAVPLRMASGAGARATPPPAPATGPDDRRPVGTISGTPVSASPLSAHATDPASPAPASEPVHGHPPTPAPSESSATTTDAPVTSEGAVIPVLVVTPVTTKTPVTTVPPVTTKTPVTTVPPVTTKTPVTTVPPVTTVTTTLPGGSPAGGVPGPGVGYRPITLVGAIMQAGLGLVQAAASP